MGKLAYVGEQMGYLIIQVCPYAYVSHAWSHRAQGFESYTHGWSTYPPLTQPTHLKK